jgi:hypothetical protein
MKICRARPQLYLLSITGLAALGGHWAVPQSVQYITFRLQASNLSATSHTGRKSCWVKILYMKRFCSPLTPQSAYRGRVEIGGVYLPSQLAIASTAPDRFTLWGLEFFFCTIKEYYYNNTFPQWRECDRI